MKIYGPLNVFSILLAQLLFPRLAFSLSRPSVPSAIKTHPQIQTHPDYAAQLILRNVSGARTILFDSEGDLIIIARDRKEIISVFQDPANSGKYSFATILEVKGLGLNHGMAIRDGFLYASSQDAVYRWPYTPKQRKRIEAKEQIVVSGITPGAGTTLGANQGHLTRTIVFSPDNQYLYVSIGSKENVDPDSSRSRVRRFPFPPLASESLRQLPFEFSSGEVWADGLRNAVALGFDVNGKLWEVDNGPDNLSRTDLGGFENNPAEEVNLLDGPVGKHYGYPYCFTAGNTTKPFLEDGIRGWQFAWPGFQSTDQWCRELQNNQPPYATVPSHSSPIQVSFYSDTSTESPKLGCDSGIGAFPCKYSGDAFIALHGSWNSETPKGYRVSRLGFNKTTQLPNSYDLQDILWQKDLQTICKGAASSKCFRPSGLAFDAAGTMFVASGVTGDLVRVYYIKGGNGITVSGDMTQSEIDDIPMANSGSCIRNNQSNFFIVILLFMFLFSVV